MDLRAQRTPAAPARPVPAATPAAARAPAARATRGTPSGGGGGGALTAGGAGAGGVGGTGGTAGNASSASSTSPLRGGCPGEASGNWACTTTGGGGGGALQLSAAGSVTVSGSISANGGAGGAGSCASAGCAPGPEPRTFGGGGGGGGSGGTLLLEGVTVTVPGTLVAAGGAGGNPDPVPLRDGDRRSRRFDPVADGRRGHRLHEQRLRIGRRERRRRGRRLRLRRHELGQASHVVLVHDDALARAGLQRGARRMSLRRGLELFERHVRRVGFVVRRGVLHRALAPRILRAAPASLPHRSNSTGTGIASDRRVPRPEVTTMPLPPPPSPPPPPPDYAYYEGSAPPSAAYGWREPASSFALGLDLEGAVPVNTPQLNGNSWTGGAGLKIRAGEQILTRSGLRLVPELGYGYDSLFVRDFYGDEFDWSMHRFFGGARLGAGHFVVPSIYSHLGYGWQVTGEPGARGNSGSRLRLRRRARLPVRPRLRLRVLRRVRRGRSEPRGGVVDGPRAAGGRLLLTSQPPASPWPGGP